MDRSVEFDNALKRLECAPQLGLAALEAAIERDLRLVAYPEGSWVPARTHENESVLDVLIVGAGQGGIAIGANLTRERVSNILLVDEKPAGHEGVWRDFARMKTLRTMKTTTGPDLGIPNLTFQAWYEARFGAKAFADLGKIDKADWQDYLGWIAERFALPIRNEVKFLGVAPEPGTDLLAVRLREHGAERIAYARKLVLAQGIETSGHWWMPPAIAALPPALWSHTADAIDFARLRGKRVAVIGAGASAFDNAATALEAGAAEVLLLCRRAELQRVQPYKIIANPGFLRNFGALDDADRWRIADHLLTIREALPKETWERASRHSAFTLMTGAGIEGAFAEDGKAVLLTASARLSVDFVIAGTGFDVDLKKRSELAAIVDDIATWADRYEPPATLRNDRLGRYPYLNDAMAFTEKAVGRAPWLANIHCFNFGATASFGAIRLFDQRHEIRSPACGAGDRQRSFRC